MSLNEMYGMNFPVQSFAVSNGFANIMNKGCYQMGMTLKTFAFGCTEAQQKEGAIDLTEFNGFVNTDIPLYKEIAEYRRSVYKNTSVGDMVDSEVIDVALFFDYLLSMSACYIEYPKYVRKGGQVEKKYEKGIFTRNPAVMAAWTGSSVSEMNAKYGTRCAVSAQNFFDCEVRAVKLLSTRNGNSVSVVRDPIPCGGFSCMPIFMQYAYLSGLWKNMEQGIVKFTYLKDNDSVRELATTVNFDILLDYYDDPQFIEKMLLGIDVFSEQQGGIMMASKQSRGYIKVPELGCSKYDKSGVRAMNLSRLLRVEKVDSVDRTFINVDLDSVLASFYMQLDRVVATNADAMKDIYEEFRKSDADNLGELEDWMTPSMLCEIMRNYADSMAKILTTTYRRSLHLFMVSNPQWFTTYTGTPVEYSSNSPASSATFGVETMDF